MFIKTFSPTTIIGTLGLFRVLLPIVLSTPILDTVVLHSVIEILEVCIHLLSDPSHTIINASLECICVIVNQPTDNLKNILTSKFLEHNDILRNRKSLKNKLFNRKLSASSIELSKTELTPQPRSLSKRPIIAGTITIETKNMQSTGAVYGSSPEKKERVFTDSSKEHSRADIGSSSIVRDEDGLLAVSASSAAGNDDKCLLSCSDNELESFKSMDFETNLDPYASSQCSMKSSATPTIQRKKSDSISLKSQKSTESIGSFFNSILSHSNTGMYICIFVSIL